METDYTIEKYSGVNDLEKFNKNDLTCINHNHQAVNPQYLPNIEEFLNDVFLYSINELKEEYKILFVCNFTKYITSMHCLENLQFLMLIYHYEVTYNKVFGCSNGSLNPRKNSVMTITSDSVDALPQNYFVSTIDDEIYNGDCWDGLRDKQIESDSDLEDSEDLEAEVCSLNSRGSNVSVNDLTILNNQWSEILNNFILPHSLHQINLSDNNYKEIAQNKSNHPDPVILLGARDEIVQLLNENVYHKFLNKYKNNSLPCSDCKCGRQKELIEQSRLHGSSISSSSRSSSPSPTATKGGFFKKSPPIMPFKFSRPSSPISISSPLLSPTSSTNSTPTTPGQISKKKMKSVISSSNGSLSSLFSHLRIKHTNHEIANEEKKDTPSHDLMIKN